MFEGRMYKNILIRIKSLSLQNETQRINKHLLDEGTLKLFVKKNIQLIKEKRNWERKKVIAAGLNEKALKYNIILMKRYSL